MINVTEHELKVFFNGGYQIKIIANVNNVFSLVLFKIGV